MSEIDIVPGMLEEIQKEFKKEFQDDKTIKRIYELIKKNAVDYYEANEFAIRCGEILSEVLQKYVTVEALPEGRMWYNIAERIMRPTLSQNYVLVADVCEHAQKNINKEIKTGLKVVRPALNESRMEGFIDKLSDAEEFETVQWVMGEPVVNYSQSVVDDSIKANAEFHYNSGLHPKIVRKLDSAETRTVVRGKRKIKYEVPCKWCKSLAGTYDYGDMPDFIADNIFRRHEGCRCTVEYYSGNTKQDVWSKKIYNV